MKAGVDYLVKTQNSQGRWDEEQFTGTGFPNHFMIRYHLYRDCFPLMALGNYLKALKASGGQLGTVDASGCKISRTH